MSNAANQAVAATAKSLGPAIIASRTPSLTFPDAVYNAVVAAVGTHPPLGKDLFKAGNCVVQSSTFDATTMPALTLYFTNCYRAPNLMQKYSGYLVPMATMQSDNRNIAMA